MDNLDICHEKGTPISTIQGADFNQKNEHSLKSKFLPYEEKIMLAPKRNEMLPMSLMVEKDSHVPNKTYKANKRVCAQPTVIVTPANSTNISY